MTREERLRAHAARMSALGMQGEHTEPVAARREDRAGQACACGCGLVVPPFTGKGEHARLYATAACGNRERVRRCLRRKAGL